jgi:hypothetical protein
VIVMRSVSDQTDSPERRAWESRDNSFVIADKAIDSMLFTVVVLIGVFLFGAFVGFVTGLLL